MLVVIFAFAALSVDIGYITVAQNELQSAADAAACAGIRVLGSGNSEGRALALVSAVELAEMNSPQRGEVLKTSDVTFGKWDSDNRVFTRGNNSPDAIKVVLHRSSDNGNPLGLFFARVLGGSDSADVSATAIAVAQGGDNQFRFLLDEDFIKKDISAIEDLAAQEGVDPEDLVSDNDGDWFIDLPPGVEIELPTGQVGDPGLFDANNPAFPFGKPGKPTIEEFLKYSENGGDSSKWGIDNPEVKALLDPLVGVSAADDVDVFPSYPDPDFVHVSPVFESDVSPLNPVYPEDIPTEHGVPAVNALGLRRGLLAFKIIGVGSDPDGPSGSLLPNLIIEIVDPATIDLSDVELYGGGSGGSPLTLVQ